MIYSYFKIGLKPAVVSCLTNALAPPLIALESCSRAQTNRQSCRLHSTKILWLGVGGFFVSDVISSF